MSHRSRSGFVVVAIIVAWLLTTLVAGCIDVDQFFPDSIHVVSFDEDASRSSKRDASQPVPWPSDDGADAGSDARPDAKGEDHPLDAFNVTSAVSTTPTTMTVTFSAPPNPAQALALASYAAPGLTFVGTPALTGNVVTLTTQTQSAGTYTLTVSGVTRAADAEPLFQATALFAGRPPFNVVAATPWTARYVIVTFDAPPGSAQASNVTHYAVPGLVLQQASLQWDNTVMLTTGPQEEKLYTVNVTGVTRAGDDEPLAAASATFMGRASFNVVKAESTGNRSMTVTFDAPPNEAMALDADNYDVNRGLGVSPQTVSGNVVTLATTPQTAETYRLAVLFMPRASDGEPLFEYRTTFAGTPATTP